MNRISRWMPTLCGSVLVAVGAAQAAPPSAPSAPAPAAVAPTEVNEQDREVQTLLNKLTELSGQASKNPQDPQAYKVQLSQADVMLHIAVRSKGKERDDWLKMAVDSLFTATLQSPQNDPVAGQRLSQIAGQIRKAYPDSKVDTYAAMQEVQADYMRALNAGGDDPTKAQVLLRDRLVRFVQDYPKSAEAPKAVMDAAELSMSLGKPDDARRCYRYLAESYAGTPIGRKAEGTLWRMSEGREAFSLRLQPLYALDQRSRPTYDVNELRGKVVVIYFWSQASSRAAADFDALKALSDRYAIRGLEMVYVNLDNDVARVQEFLSGRLLTGIHLHQRGGLESEVAGRMGIRSLPECFIISRDGKLARHSLQANQLEAEINAQMAGR